MKTVEMLNELVNNPNKKFKHIGSKTDICVVSIGKDGNVDWIDADGTFTRYYLAIRGTLDWDWKEVIEPVDFLTAYNDCSKNLTRYKSVNNSNFTVSDQIMLNPYGYGVEIIINDSKTVELDCKWIKAV